MVAEDQLKRIEEKIDKFTELEMSNQITMARVEEKISDLEIRRQESHERVNKISSTMDKIDSELIQTRTRVELNMKILWGIIAAAAAGFITQFLDIL